MNSVQAAVDTLNIDGNRCPGGICIVFSERRRRYVLLYRADMKVQAMNLFNLRVEKTPKMSWTAFKCGQERKGRINIRSMAMAAISRIAVVGDPIAVSGHWSMSKLVRIRDGRLADQYNTVKYLD